MMRTIVIAAGLAALSLTACGQAGEKSGTDGGKAAAAAAGLPDGPTPGLWRITSSVQGAPAGMAMPAVETCVTEAKFQPPQGQTAPGAGPEGSGVQCTNVDYRRDGDAVVGSATCTLPNGGKSESTTRISGDFTRSYKMEVDSKITMAGMPGPQETKMTMTAERVGDCPAGATAGG